MTTTADAEHAGGRDREPTLDEHTAPLDVMLTDAALGSLRRFLPGAAGWRLAARLAARPGATVRRSGNLVKDLATIAVGRSELEPSRKDRRFADPAWTGNPVLHRIMQGYLATGSTVHGLLDDADLDWRTDQRMRFLADNAVAAMAPSNVPFLNPSALKATIDTGGANFARGLVNFARDMSAPPRIPSMVDCDPFTVGGNLAVTPGGVVLRTPVFELIQYRPTTPRVREVPLLLAPPTINKYYIADLAPGRSMIEHFVGSGQQVFVMSWRNPGAEHAEWGLDTYVQAVHEALDVVQRVCKIDRSVLMGLCSGGIIASMAASNLVATGQESRLAGLVLGVTVLDQERAGFASAALDPGLAASAAAASARRGYVDGRSLAEMFAWLRPEDLVWNYWQNNYLLGKRPPAFDVLYWNADTTRLAAGLHRDFLELGLDNALVTPGQATALGEPVDLSAVKVDSYVVAGTADHICPWQSCYRTTQLLGGATRFVLSSSGHVAALVNPPTNAKARFQVNDANPESSQEWLSGASTQEGSWWPDFVTWLEGHSGADKAAPKRLGARGLQPMEDAPGTYVLQT